MWPARSTRISIRSAQDLLRRGFVRHAGNVAPVDVQRPVTLGRGVGRGHVRVQEDFHFLAVVGRDHRFQEEAHRVLPEMGRDVAHPQSPTARTVVRVRRRNGRQRVGVTRSPRPMLRIDKRQRQARFAIEHKQQVAVMARVIRIDRDRAAEGCDRFVHLALRLQGGARDAQAPPTKSDQARSPLRPPALPRRADTTAIGCRPG